MNAKEEGAAGRANEGQYPMTRSQGDIASSDVDSNTAEAVGHVVRLHSTQQKTLCASKHYIGNDFIMDQEFVIDEQKSSSRRECQGHIVKVDVGAVEPIGGQTPIQTKETVLRKKSQRGVKNFIKLSPKKIPDVDADDSNNKSHTDNMFEESYSVRFQEVSDMPMLVSRPKLDHDNLGDVKSQRPTPRQNKNKSNVHNLRIDTKAKEVRVFSQPQSGIPERRVLQLKNQTFETDYIEAGSLPQPSVAPVLSQPTSSRKNLNYLSTSISNAMEPKAESSAPGVAHPNQLPFKSRSTRHKAFMANAKPSQSYQGRRVDGTGSLPEGEATGEVLIVGAGGVEADRGPQRSEWERGTGMRGDPMTGRRRAGPRQADLRSFDQREEQLSLINATMQNRQLIGYKINSQPLLQYDQEIDSINQGLKNANLDLAPVADELKCGTCELLVEQRKNQIWNQQAHGKPSEMTQKRQLMDCLLQNRPTCTDCKRKRINRVRGGAKFRTGGFLNANSPYHRRKQLRMKHFLELMYKNGTGAASVPSRISMNEQGSQTDAPMQTSALENTNNDCSSKNDNRNSPTSREVHQKIRFVLESGANTRTSAADAKSTLMHVGGLEDIDDFYNGRTHAGVKSIDIDIGDNGADSTFKIESLQAAVRKLPGLQTKNSFFDGVVRAENHLLFSPEGQSSEAAQPASSALSIPRQPPELNSSIPNDDSQSISSPLRNEQIYSRIRKNRMAGPEPQQQHESAVSSPGAHFVEASQLKKETVQVAEPGSSSQPVFSTFKIDGTDQYVQQQFKRNQIFSSFNKEDQKDQEDPADAQKYPSGLPVAPHQIHGGTVMQWTSPRSMMVAAEPSAAPPVPPQEVEQPPLQEGATLTKFSSVKPQITHYGKFIQQKINTEMNQMNTAPGCNQNILVGQSNLIELSMFNNPPGHSPQENTKIATTPRSPTFDNTNNVQNFDNEQLRAFLQQQISQSSREQRAMFGYNQVGPYQIPGGNINANVLQPSESHNSSGEGIIIEYRDDNSSIIKLLGQTLHLPPGSFKLGSRTQINSQMPTTVPKPSQFTSTPQTQLEPTLSPYLFNQATTNRIGLSKLNLTAKQPKISPTHQIGQLQPPSSPQDFKQAADIQREPSGYKEAQNEDTEAYAGLTQPLQSRMGRPPQLRMPARREQGEQTTRDDDGHGSLEQDILEWRFNNKESDFGAYRMIGPSDGKKNYRGAAGKYWSVDHFLSQRYRSSIASERKREVLERKRRAKQQTKENATTDIRMLTATRQSDAKAEKNTACVVPNSRMSERYGDRSEGNSMDAQNNTQFKEKAKEQPDLALVQISKVRVFKAREQEQEAPPLLAESPIIRQSLSIDKTTDFAGNKSHSQYQGSEVRNTDELEDNQPLSTQRREGDMNQSNKVKTVIPSAEMDNEENASSYNYTEDKQRRVLEVTAKAEKETQEGEMKSQGTDQEDVLRLMKNQESSPYHSPRKVTLKTMNFGEDDFKANKRFGPHQDIYKLALSSKVSSFPQSHIQTPIMMAEWMRQHKEFQTAQNAQNQQLATSQRCLDEILFENNKLNGINQVSEGALDRWNDSKDKQLDLSNYEIRNAQEIQTLSDHDQILQNQFQPVEDMMLRQSNIMPMYRSLQIQEGQFNPEYQDTTKSDDKEIHVESNIKFLDPLRDFNFENLARKHATRNPVLTTIQSSHTRGSRGSKKSKADQVNFNNSALVQREPGPSLDNIEVQEYNSSGFGMTMSKPSPRQLKILRKINVSSIEPVVDSYRHQHYNRSQQFPQSSRYEDSTTYRDASIGPLKSMKESTLNTMDSVRLRQSFCFDRSTKHSTDLHFQNTNRSQRYGLSTIVSKNGSKQAQYKRNVHMRQFYDIRQNLEESIKTFRKSQRVRKFIDDNNGALEFREGSIGHRKKELQAPIGLNARLKKLKNMDVGAGLTRRGSCFAMQTHQLDQHFTIEKIRKSLESQHILPLDRIGSIKHQNVMIGDQDTPIINSAFDIETTKKSAVEQPFVADYATIQPKQAKPTSLKMKTGVFTPIGHNDYAQEPRDVQATEDNSKEVVAAKKPKNSIVRRNSTETSKQDQTSEILREANEKANKMTESHLSGKSRNATRTQAQRTSEAAKANNQGPHMAKTIYSSMYKPEQSQSRKKKQDNKDLYLEIPDDSIPENQNYQHDNGISSIEQSQQAIGYSMESKSIMDEKLENHVEDHTIDITPCRHDDELNLVQSQVMSTTMYIASSQPSKAKEQQVEQGDFMHKLKLPTIKVDGARPRYSREIKRSSIDERYFKNSFSLLNQKPNFRIIKQQRNSLIEVSTAFENTSLQGWHEQTESNGSFYKPSRTAKTKASSPAKHMLADRVEKIVKKSQKQSVGNGSPAQAYQPKFVKAFASKQSGNYLYKMYQDYTRTLDPPAVTVQSAKVQATSTTRPWPLTQKGQHKVVIVKADDKRK